MADGFRPIKGPGSFFQPSMPVCTASDSGVAGRRALFQGQRVASVLLAAQNIAVRINGFRHVAPGSPAASGMKFGRECCLYIAGGDHGTMAANKDGSRRKPRPMGIKCEPWTTKEDEFLKKVAPGRRIADVTHMINVEFGRSRTPQAIRNRMSKLGVRCGVHPTKNLVCRKGVGPKSFLEAEAVIDYAAFEFERRGLVGLAVDLDIYSASIFGKGKSKTCTPTAAPTPMRGYGQSKTGGHMDAFSDINRVYLSGRLVRDARYVDEGDEDHARLTFTIGMEEAGSHGSSHTHAERHHYFDVRIRASDTELSHEQMKEGAHVAVEGNLKMESLSSQEGLRRLTYYVDAARVQLLSDFKGRLETGTQPNTGFTEAGQC